MSDNVKVSIKVRPLIKREKDSKLTSQWRVKGNTIAHIDGTYDRFVFDHIFDETASSKDLFNTVCRPVILSALNGINGTIFAYGQTSSGKTYTMIGDEEEPGVVPLTATEIFEEIKKIKERQFLIRVGFIEIYNEKIHDLLNTCNTNMKIVENQYGDVTVNSSEKIISSAEQILMYMDKGNKARKIGETNMNERSSRSHTIFRIMIESRMIEGESDNEAVQIGIINLVDLAGSERADQTGATGSRFKEGVCINRSLLSLSCVIQKLSENPDKQFINYRDSKLTRILQASLGGNAVTSMICNITPAAIEETYYTLCFANRAKNIRNKPKVNEILSDAALMKRLEREIQRLQNELRSEQNKNSQINLVELQNAITLRTNQLINSNQAMGTNNDHARRRTWCPSTSEIPRLARPTSSIASVGGTLMGPPPSNLLVPNGMTPNIAIRTISADGCETPQANGFQATLALMGADYDQIPYRNLLDNRDLLARQMRSVSPVGNGLLNPFSADEFVPGEQISFGHCSLSPLSSMARDLHTPKSLRRTRRSSTGDSPPFFDYEKRCRELEQELIELQEFTKLEKTVELDYLKQELSKRDDSLAGLREDIEEKEQRIEQLEERCTQLEIELKDQQARVSKAEIDLLQAAKERQAAVRQAELHSNQLTGVEFEYERFRQRSEAREKELIESLQEARGSSGGTVTPNNADGFRVDQKREEMKRLEMQNYEFSLQLEECNKQIEQLKASYLEQHRKLEQVKQTVLQHHHHPVQSVLAGGKGDEVATHSLVQSLRKLLLSGEDIENVETVSPQTHNDQSTIDHDPNATTLGDAQTVQELVKIIETLEQNLHTSEQEKNTNGTMLDEVKRQLDGKIATIAQLEKQLQGWKQKFEAQTSEYDEMSTQLMDQMQESEELRKEFEALQLKHSTEQSEAETHEADFSKQIAVLKETLERATNEKEELHRTGEALRVEIVTLKKALEEKVTLVDTLEKEKRTLTTNCDEVMKSLGEANSRTEKMRIEIDELKVKLANGANLKDGLEKMFAEQTKDLSCTIEKQRAEMEALAKEKTRLADEMELLQKNAQENLRDQIDPKMMETLMCQKENLEQQVNTLREKMETCQKELHAAETERDRQIQLFSQEKESFEQANGELRREDARLEELITQAKEDRQHVSDRERCALKEELDLARQTYDTQERRVNELQQEVESYRTELQTIQKEYTALMEKEKVDKETYDEAHRKYEEEIELSRETIDQLKKQMASISEQEANGRETIEKAQLAQKTMEERIVELEQEVQRHVKGLEAARTEHSALVEGHNKEKENFENIRQKLMEDIESSKKTIESLTEEKQDLLERHSGEHRKEHETRAEQMEELRKGTACLEQRLKEKEEDICKYVVALETAQKEKDELMEQQKLSSKTAQDAQQLAVEQISQLKSTLVRLEEEKRFLENEQAERLAGQQTLEQQLDELRHGRDALALQVEEREQEILRYITELETLRAEQIRLVEQQNGTCKELEARNDSLVKELDSLQQTVDQLLSENESLLKEQLEGEESLKQRLASELEELEKLRSCRDESERLVAQLERDLTTVRAELEMVRRELLAEKQRHDDSEQSKDARIRSMTEEIETQKRAIVALEDEKQRLLEAEGRLTRQLEENNRRTLDLEVKQQEMESFREELRRENNDLTVAVQELSGKLVNLEEQMDGNEAAQRKTIDTLVREKQAHEDAAHKHEQEAKTLRRQLDEASAKFYDYQQRHETAQKELQDVRVALEESTTVRGRLEADITESSSVRDVLERELRELKTALESLDSKLENERYEQERQTSANLRRELDEKQKELESFMATGRPSLGDGRVVQALRRENEDLLKQLNEARQIDGLKGKQLQERIDELQRLETEITRMRDEMATMRHESSFNEKEEQITQLRRKVTEVEKVREETVHQKRSLERAYDQLRFKHQTLAKEVDELRRTTDKERKSRRQSTHDDRRGLIFNSKEVATMTDPTSTNCGCLEMDAQIKELRNKLTLKDCQLNTQKLISSANPLKNEITEMRRKMDEHNREKVQVEQELREVLAELDRERKDRKRHCTQCMRHSRQQNARCDKAVQAYHPEEKATTAAVSVSIVSTTRSPAASTGTPARNGATMETVAALQSRCDEQQNEYDKLMEKYQKMKQLCRLRNERIVSLGQSIAEKENESTNVNRNMEVRDG
ncbi:uncharacterized protein LOC131266335 isoform X2 [Anopheles coustani]|uniref:uncharacterized protein LOC131266335 isoform X2 n=1 Tax=Anopheles coustani TaxID=139045 RepID=UPI0026580098|nr:uncharacterized protein LOC131266335 isoform X2 [Anopheles coustani]